MSDDETIKKAVEELWDKYDSDKSGSLEKDEVRRLVDDYFKTSNNDKKIDDKDFDKIFEQFDQNKDGTIQKDEMAEFLKAAMDKAGSGNPFAGLASGLASNLTAKFTGLTDKLPFGKKD